MYVDMSETMNIVNLSRQNERSEVKFERRGWFTSEAFKLTGETFYVEAKKKKVQYTINGNWNKEIKLTNELTKEI